jgi:hypothetical protein
VHPTVVGLDLSRITGYTVGAQTFSGATRSADARKTRPRE